MRPRPATCHSLALGRSEALTAHARESEATPDVFGRRSQPNLQSDCEVLNMNRNSSARSQPCHSHRG
jgi:hypothetical protein